MKIHQNPKSVGRQELEKTNLDEYRTHFFVNQQEVETNWKEKAEFLLKNQLSKITLIKYWTVF